jgi:pimeloyl-ACP methyl ester carboxylesterase
LPYVEAESASLYYEVHGDGPGLVLAHGGDGNTLTWWQQVPYFSREYRVVTFDSRGMGRSACTHEAPRLFGDDLRRVLDAASLERAALVAHSRGGYGALPFALEHPERVSCLVLSGSPAGVTLDGHERTARRLWDKVMRGLAPSEIYLGERFKRDRPELSFLFDRICDLNPPARSGWRTLPMEDRLAQQFLVEPDRLADFSTPTLMIASEEDPSYFLPDIRELVDLLGAELVVMPGVGHPGYFEEPEAFNAIVRDYLRAQGWGATTSS